MEDYVVLDAIIRREEAELAECLSAFVASDEKAQNHAKGANYEKLEPGVKSAFTRKKNELNAVVDDQQKRYGNIKEKLTRTKNMRPEGAGAATSAPQSYGNTRVPTVPKFRSESKDSIQDAFEFLEQCKALFEAHFLPKVRWHTAMLTGLTSVDREWTAQNLKGLDWNVIEEKFISHFESPILKDKLLTDLMRIRKGKGESVQHYCDRFTSLMRRTGKKNNDDNLIAVFIAGLDHKLEEMMYVARATKFGVEAT